MKLEVLNTENVKWFDVDNTDLKVKLRLPSRDELLRDFRACNRRDNKQNDYLDDHKWFKIVAEKYLLDIKGLEENGKPVPYTVEIGYLVMKHQLIGPHIDKLLTAVGEWFELGFHDEGGAS